MNIKRRKDQNRMIAVLWIGIATGALIVGAIAHGQELPDAPQPVKHNDQLTKTDRAIWIGIAAAHAADYGLTEECIKPNTGCHEGVLPAFIWKHPAAFMATEASFSLGQVVISRELRKHHHTLARTWDIGNLIAFTGVDLYVYELCKDGQSKAPIPLKPIRR